MADPRKESAYCESARDFVPRDLLRPILTAEEEHVDFIDRQMDLIKQIGIECYIMLNSAGAPDQSVSS